MARRRQGAPAPIVKKGGFLGKFVAFLLGFILGIGAITPEVAHSDIRCMDGLVVHTALFGGVAVLCKILIIFGEKAVKACIAVQLYLFVYVNISVVRRKAKFCVMHSLDSFLAECKMRKNPQNSKFEIEEKIFKRKN